MISVEKLSLSDRVKACDQNIVSDMGGEKVMLSIQNGNYYNLGSIGGRIWEVIGNFATVAEVVDLLLEEYDVDRTECEQQVLDFLDHMRKEGLVLVDGEAASADQA
ncbi:lasso peptide biosynthesis PqqD family chaperone [Paenibacillus sp. J5C_2022]|uniref:lasso peptide biosynthesis PqqD family chaperone n=1 Tax=Paenibacillus sp. J5C2022 TaxID=2977129 RepID=UPI0021D3CE9D|nr:lasso peptide biosynthesis PqqD family chaperone [Paenibacillus sp. J5C2022]MCU6710281.1 lasso peptide biosynthesis PqqD family chaperone [Paenibacillus sp. J5C2022]